MNETRIKKLPETVRKNGFAYQLVKRDDKKCMYAQHNGMGRVIAYEVFKTKLGSPHPKALEDVKNYDKVERFPGDEEFGVRAWTYCSLEKAEESYSSILPDALVDKILSAV